MSCEDEMLSPKEVDYPSTTTVFKIVKKNSHWLRKGLSQPQGNEARKQAGVVILIPVKIDVKPKLIRRDREGHYILIKGKIYLEDIKNINIYVLSTRAPST